MLTTTIKWVPGAPVEPTDESLWFVLTGANRIYTARYNFISKEFWAGSLGGFVIDTNNIIHHAPYQPPQETPSAREMIEAEIEEVRAQRVKMDTPEFSFKQGVLYGLKFGMQCLDKEGKQE